MLERRWRAWTGGAAGLALAMAVAACSSDAETSSTRCADGGTCGPGFECRSDFCVPLDGGGGTGGGGGAGGGGGGLTTTSKLDLVLMVDNSISMADKQQILADALPPLVGRLVEPRCVDDADPLREVPRAGGACPAGAHEELSAVDDLHVGVVSSSLGGHGAELCSPASSGFLPEQDDHAHLLGTVRNGLNSHLDQGFLRWGPDATNRAALETDVRAHVLASGENGCGFEASLESWYRFLIHPAPPESVQLVDGRTTVVGVDQALLDQRRAFLRPDSMLVVVMLTDENDCSIDDDRGYGWLAGEPNRLPRATTACAADPNDPCCRGCQLSEPSGPPPGCTALGSDPSCALGPYPDPLDDWNLRCWEQKRRFGLDLLYPVERYLTGLRDATLCPASPYGDMSCTCAAEDARRARAGEPPLTAAECAAAVGASVPNPLFTDLQDLGRPVRSPALVTLMGIVGVPWQDLATDGALAGEPLAYRSASELQASGRWDVILGEPAAWVRPADPFMVESPDPRSGSNPITGDPIVQPGGAPNAINGSEFTTLGGDLQYACIFPLAAPHVCAPGQRGCDCETGTDNPLCQGATQLSAKAYPGLRQLGVLRSVGEQAVVASVCPKVTEPARVADPEYGYAPAIDALVRAIAPRMVQRPGP